MGKLNWHWKLIGFSLAFAGMILLSSLLLAGSPYRETVTFLLIAIWWVPFSYGIAKVSRQCP